MSVTVVKESIADKALASVQSAKNNSEKEFLILTYFIGGIERALIKDVISTIQGHGYFVAYFFNQEEQYQESFMISLYICWTQEAKIDAASRGYVFLAQAQ